MFVLVNIINSCLDVVFTNIIDLFVNIVTLIKIVYRMGIKMKVLLFILLFWFGDVAVKYANITNIPPT